MANRNTLGGVIHTYQQYDPARFPSPTQPPPDLVSPALEHMLMFGEHRELTEEELARAIRLDPSQIAGLGPSIDALIAMLQERKRKILARYETKTVRQRAAAGVCRSGDRDARCPRSFAQRFYKAVQDRADSRPGAAVVRGRRRPVAVGLCAGGLIERLGEKYQVDELAAKYEFTGHEAMTVPQALAIKEELEKIDELLKQLEEARKTAQIGIIDMELLSEFAEPGDIDQLSALQQQIQDYLREMAEQQGLEQKAGSFQLTPKAYRLFQGKLLERLFSELAPSRTGRHQGPVVGEGAVELQATKPYEFGDSIAHLDIPGTFINALVRDGPGMPVRFQRRRHPGPPHAQHAQVRHVRADGHERLDALRRAVHQRQADGARARRPDPHASTPATACSSSRCTRSPSWSSRGGSSNLMPKPVTLLRPGRAACRPT